MLTKPIEVKRNDQTIIIDPDDDYEAQAFNLGYDDYFRGLANDNPFEPNTRAWRFYNHGVNTAMEQDNEDEEQRAGDIEAAEGQAEEWDADYPGLWDY